MTNYEVVKKLIGPITPLGESYADINRYINLEATITLVDSLLNDIKVASSFSSCQQASMKKIGKRAAEFLNEYGIVDEIQSA